MSSDRKLFRAAVYAIIKQDDKVLMMRRYNTGWSDGMYTLPAGHIDDGETVLESMIREVKEETGIEINPQDVDFVHVMQQEGDRSYFDFYFVINKWENEPEIIEPNKCDDLKWITIEELDSIPVLGNVRSALNHIKNKVLISDYQDAS